MLDHHLDFTISNHGSILILRAQTDTAYTWIEDHLPEDAMQWAGGIVVEPRYIDDIVASIVDDNLSIACT